MINRRVGRKCVVCWGIHVPLGTFTLTSLKTRYKSAEHICRWNSAHRLPPPPAPRPLATTGSDRGFLTLDRHLRIDLKVHILLETFFSVSIYVDFFLKSVFRFQRDPSMTLPKKMLPLLKFISYHAIHFCFFLVFMKYNSRISYIIKYLIGKIYPIISPIMNIVLSISQHP